MDSWCQVYWQLCRSDGLSVWVALLIFIIMINCGVSYVTLLNQILLKNASSDFSAHRVQLYNGPGHWENVAFPAGWLWHVNSVSQWVTGPSLESCSWGAAGCTTIPEMLFLFFCRDPSENTKAGKGCPITIPYNRVCTCKKTLFFFQPLEKISDLCRKRNNGTALFCPEGLVLTPRRTSALAWRSAVHILTWRTAVPLYHFLDLLTFESGHKTLVSRNKASS